MEIKQLLEQALSKSTCTKHKMAVVILTTKGEVVLGWNGYINGDHECARKAFSSGQNLNKCLGMCAEKRAISYAARKGISLDGSTLYMHEWFPCELCAKMMVEAGIKKLVTPDPVYKGKELVPKLRNSPFNFELAEKVLRNAGVEIEIDSSIV